MPAHFAPLDQATSLASVLELARPGEVLGVWIDIRGPARPLPLRIPASPRWISLLLSPDLASLLARARLIVVSREGVPWIGAADALAAARRVEVETAEGTLAHPLDGIAPEAVLAERRSFRRIVASRMRYAEPG
jgi:hypothetical protein